MVESFFIRTTSSDSIPEPAQPERAIMVQGKICLEFDRISTLKTREFNRAPRRVALLQLIPDEASGISATVHELSDRLGEPAESIECELKVLVRNRFVKRLTDV
jgi:hypothetical protein